MSEVRENPSVAPPSTVSSHDYTVLRQKMTSAMRRVCPMWMADQREDLVQVAMLKLVRRPPQGEIQTAYVYRVAHSVVVDEIRRRKRRKEDLGSTPTLMDHVVISGQKLPDDKANQAEVSAAIIDCLSLLKDDRKRAVTLYLQGHSVPEIAKLLDFKRKKAENLVYRGLGDLRTSLAKLGLAP